MILFHILFISVLCDHNFDDPRRGVPAIGANETVPIRVRRFVHRHACVGIDGEGADSIGCVEAHAVTFEHMLTPSMLWCNDKDCVSEFNETFAVHTISCTPLHCDVLLHCSEALEHVKYAVLLTLAAIVVLICAPFYFSMPALQDALREHAGMGNKNL